MYTVRVVYFGEVADYTFDTLAEAEALVEKYRNSTTIAYML